MSISIIIPTKNESHNLPLLLRSIVLSKTKPKEVIIVDNHSTDNTLKIAQQYMSKNLKITNYKLFKKGPERSPQKNFGAQKATGTHLFFLDADMELSEDLLKELTQLGKINKKAAKTGGFWRFGETGYARFPEIRLLKSKSMLLSAFICEYED